MEALRGAPALAAEREGYELIQGVLSDEKLTACLADFEIGLLREWAEAFRQEVRLDWLLSLAKFHILICDGPDMPPEKAEIRKIDSLCAGARAALRSFEDKAYDKATLEKIKKNHRQAVMDGRTNSFETMVSVVGQELDRAGHPGEEITLVSWILHALLDGLRYDYGPARYRRFTGALNNLVRMHLRGRGLSEIELAREYCVELEELVTQQLVVNRIAKHEALFLKRVISAIRQGVSAETILQAVEGLHPHHEKGRDDYENRKNLISQAITAGTEMSYHFPETTSYPHVFARPFLLLRRRVPRKYYMEAIAKLDQLMKAELGGGGPADAVQGMSDLDAEREAYELVRGILWDEELTGCLKEYEAESLRWWAEALHQGVRLDSLLKAVNLFMSEGDPDEDDDAEYDPPVKAEVVEIMKLGERVKHALNPLASKGFGVTDSEGISKKYTEAVAAGEMTWMEAMEAIRNEMKKHDNPDENIVAISVIFDVMLHNLGYEHVEKKYRYLIESLKAVIELQVRGRGLSEHELAKELCRDLEELLAEAVAARQVARHEARFLEKVIWAIRQRVSLRAFLLAARPLSDHAEDSRDDLERREGFIAGGLQRGNDMSYHFPESPYVRALQVPFAFFFKRIPKRYYLEATETLERLARAELREVN